ncbi:MAG: HD domain-containing protein [Synechococcaceae cyanobacterium]|nr:HD domain-containing protein [Synechococcaceae cyanobacterium]
MNHSHNATSRRYGEALAWAEQLHRHQRRKGKDVPYISHLIAVSALVWEDGGTEDQAIAALLHDAIEDAGQSHTGIAERFGEVVADIVRDCTDCGEGREFIGKEPWLVRKARFLASLPQLAQPSLLVIAADKAHNASDMVVDASSDPRIWSRFTAGLEGSAWYLLRLHQQLRLQLPNSRSVDQLARAVGEILASDAYQSFVPDGIAAAVWAASYVERQAVE